MFLAGKDPATSSVTGGADYAFKKLERWKAEGPTERNKKMAQLLISHGSSGAHWSLLVDLALEWSDLPMWNEVLKKSAGKWYTPKLGLDELVRAWGAFTFDRVKNMLVHFALASMPYRLAHPSHCRMHLAESRKLSMINPTPDPRSSS